MHVISIYEYTMSLQMSVNCQCWVDKRNDVDSWLWICGNNIFNVEVYKQPIDIEI